MVTIELIVNIIRSDQNNLARHGEGQKRARWTLSVVPESSGEQGMWVLL